MEEKKKQKNKNTINDQGVQMDNGNLFSVSELGKYFLNVPSSFGRLIAMTNDQKRVNI